jgi:hypothetical protein
MQSMFSFITEEANAVAKYEPQNVNKQGDKIWFSYWNNAGKPISAFYDKVERKFKQVVIGEQYGKDGVAIRNLIAQPVIEKILS